MIGTWLHRLRRRRAARQARRTRLPYPVWRRVTARLTCLGHLDRRRRVRLRRLAGEFLAAKTFTPIEPLELTEDMCMVIAVQACLPVLELGLDWYDGWREIVVYPDSFLVDVTVTDEAGVEHQWREARGGEAWGAGPVILSWRDARPGGHPHGPGSNVVIHEFAHKLDWLDGQADGRPPLHPDMDPQAWHDAFQAAFDDLRRRERHHRRTPIDPYAATAPAECFAVMSEVFFERPGQLVRAYPAVYRQLATFYRQNPLAALRKWAQKTAKGRRKIHGRNRPAPAPCPPRHPGHRRSQ